MYAKRLEVYEAEQLRVGEPKQLGSVKTTDGTGSIEPGVVRAIDDISEMVCTGRDEAFNNEDFEERDREAVLMEKASNELQLFGLSKNELNLSIAVHLIDNEEAPAVWVSLRRRILELKAWPGLDDAMRYNLVVLTFFGAYVETWDQRTMRVTSESEINRIFTDMLESNMVQGDDMNIAISVLKKIGFAGDKLSEIDAMREDFEDLPEDQKVRARQTLEILMTVRERADSQSKDPEGDIESANEQFLLEVFGGVSLEFYLESQGVAKGGSIFRSLKNELREWILKNKHQTKEFLLMACGFRVALKTAGVN